MSDDTEADGLPLGTEDRATRVHRLAVPLSVTMRATRLPNTYGGGHHFSVAGFTHGGEELFEYTVSGSAADSASEAIRVQLDRLRERGW